MTAGRGLNSVITGMQIEAAIIPEFFHVFLSFPEGEIIFPHCTHFLHILFKRVNIHVFVATSFFWQGEGIIQKSKPMGDTAA